MVPARRAPVAAPWARRTPRRSPRLPACGLALGGEAGARRGARGGRRPSPTTLRRRLRAAPVPDAATPRGRGGAAWAGRRGHRDGTLLGHLEEHRGLALRPARSAERGASWRAQPPPVLVVWRARRALAAAGLRRGAPQAVQVGERCPLGTHLREAVEACRPHQWAALQGAAARTAQALTRGAGPGPGTAMDRGRPQGAHGQPPRRAVAPPPRPAAGGTPSEAIPTRHAQGPPVAPRAPPSPRRPQRAGQVGRPAMAYLMRRWREGLPRRRPPLPPIRRGRRRAPSRAPGGAPPQRGHRPRSGLSTNGRRAPPRSRRRLRCARPFSPRVRERRGDALAAGRTAAAARAIEARARCAQGLQADLAAVTAGRTRPGSPGPGEGHGNRLQRRKRQGSGRADVGRWRPRVRHAA